jgi:hypothetical protein
MHWFLWASLFAIVCALIYMSTRKEMYAPPRDQNTEPPYVDPSSNTVPDSQMAIYKDMGGLDTQLQAGNPILNFIQGDPSSNVIYGDFVANESDGGSAKMYSIQDASSNAYTDNGQYLPEITSSTIPFIGDLLPPVPKNMALVSPSSVSVSQALTTSPVVTQ